MLRMHISYLYLAFSCLLSSGFCQTIETQRKPPAVVFEDESGKVVSSVPVDTKQHIPIVEVKVSVPANTAYVLNSSGKSKDRSLSAVNLTTQHVDRVLGIGEGKQVELVLSPDGRRLFAYTLKDVIDKNGRLAWEHMQKSDHAGAVVTAIDTASNEVVGTFDLLNNPAVHLPKARFVETFFSVTTDGERIVAKVDGFEGRIVRTGSPNWVRLLVFSLKSPQSVFVIDPAAPIVSYKFSEDGKHLFVTSEDKGRRSETVVLADLEKATTLTRTLDNPPTRRERLGTLLEGVAPSGIDSTGGMWAFTSGGLRFVSTAGDIAPEIALPVEDEAIGRLSLDRAHFFVAVPSGDQHSGVLHIVDLKMGTVSTHPLNDVPRKLTRLGATNQLWVVGSREMRSISEVGELGERPLLLNKPQHVEAGDSGSGDVFLDGYPGETITLGDDHAAILIVKKKGGSLHRVALIDLKGLQVESIVTTMTKGEQAKIKGGRWLETLAVAAADVAAGTAIGVAANIPPPNLFTIPLPESLMNESLAAGSNGNYLYVLDTDTHKVSVINVGNGTVTGKMPVNNAVTAIEVARDGKHLLGSGQGFLQSLALNNAEQPATK
jgi:hypothetical protein